MENEKIIKIMQENNMYYVDDDGYNEMFGNELNAREMNIVKMINNLASKKINEILEKNKNILYFDYLTLDKNILEYVFRNSDENSYVVKD